MEVNSVPHHWNVDSAWRYTSFVISISCQANVIVKSAPFIGISGKVDIYLCMDPVEIFKALSNKTRLQILQWLKEPELNFPEQAQAGYDNGVCVGQIQKKAGLSQSTVSEYLSVLQRAGLVKVQRVGQWTYYTRNDETFASLSQLIESDI